MDILEITIHLVKLILIFLLMVHAVPLLVWVERRGSAFIQNRFGPNRVGPLGLTQLLADAIKFIFKEEFAPPKGRVFLFYLAPIIALIPASLALAALPLSPSFTIESLHLWGQVRGPYQITLQGFDAGEIGLVFVLGVSSLGVYSMLVAGWSSGNKYSLLGGLRASAQMISYELGLGLSLAGLLLIFSTFNFSEIIILQDTSMNFIWRQQEHIVPFLPNWGIFYQPMAALLFLVCMFAETNRLPFDLPEAEAELVAGYHTEYGGLKMNMFYIGEYGHMLVASTMFAILFLGGYSLAPLMSSPEIHSFFVSEGYTATQSSVFTALIGHGVLVIKVIFLLWLFIWVRWTLPRFRYDQLMSLGWKTILPWAFVNMIVTALVIFFAKS